MATYRCLADLHGKTLEYGDTVIFKDITYTVQEEFLSCSGYNDKIFRDLEISKSDIAEQAYGYYSFSGDWPECKKDDYPALTRLVVKLYEIIEEKTSTVYKITTPGKTGISPEEVKELIIKHGGIINDCYHYNSDNGVYHWKKGELVDIVSASFPIYGIEVSPTTEITTKKEEKHETQFQRKKARIERGTRPEGSTVCGRRSKASVAVGHLGYRKVIGI